MVRLEELEPEPVAPVAGAVGCPAGAPARPGSAKAGRGVSMQTTVHTSTGHANGLAALVARRVRSDS
jgi:hypothetical protein